MLRRTLLTGTLGAAVALLFGRTLAAQEIAATDLTTRLTSTKPQSARSAPRTIKIHASRFEFSPNHITLKQNETATLELTSSDFTHGFSLPGLNVRTDILPGQITRLTITAQQSGDFIFLCDNFCGEGHEKMQGKLTVIAAS